MRCHFGSRLSSRLAAALFENAIATPEQDIEMTSDKDTHKEKGGAPNVKPATTAHLEQKAREAAEAENLVNRALNSEEMDIDMETEGEILVQKTLMDSMEPEAHVNMMLATELERPKRFEDPELAEAFAV